MLVEVGRIHEIAPGGMKTVAVEGKNIVLCNYEGDIYAIERRCGHMNAPLDMGSLEGYILTCPMHNAQFDIRTGEALSNPVPRDFGGEVPPPKMLKFFTHVAMLMSHIKTHNIKTYKVFVEKDMIKVDL